MLCLRRRENQRIIIEVEGRKVVLVVRQITEKRVQLGFTADKDVQIWREELREVA